jgi:hypothetical protein
MIAIYEQDTQAGSMPLGREAELRDLEIRLDRGLTLIEERKRAGAPVERLEDHWINLLHEYQAAFDRAN